MESINYVEDEMSDHSKIETILKNIEKWLPEQGPIKVFIHQNTLHNLLDKPFFDSIRLASEIYGARPLMPPSFYIEMFRSGKIKQTSLDKAIFRALEVENINASSQQYLKNKLLQMKDFFLPPGILENGLRQRWKEKFNLDINNETHPILFRLLSQYLDQGISIWPFPDNKQGFLKSISDLVENSYFKIPGLSSPVSKEYLKKDPWSVVPEILELLLGSNMHWETYIFETCLAHPGWSGMVNYLEKHPESLLSSKKVSLIELISLELIIEIDLLKKNQKHTKINNEKLSDKNENLAVLPFYEGHNKIPSENEKLLEIWHNALEISYLDTFLKRIQDHKAQDIQVKDDNNVQLFFCIDDRECSLRRHIEINDPQVQTFGTAGFFGVDCFFQKENEVFPSKHCPVPIKPKHLIVLKSKKTDSENQNKTNNSLRKWMKDPSQFFLERRANLTLSSFLYNQIFGFRAAIKLAFDILKPNLNPPLASSLWSLNNYENIDLSLNFDSNSESYQKGYSPQEMADRVYGLLQSTGLYKNGFAPLVIFIGHGASSVNNPYFSAYDCGACSGNAGAANAKAFSQMANDPKVREILKSQQTPIPDSTWFVGAIHDTTRDEIVFFDENKIPLDKQIRFSSLKENISRSLKFNAKERSEKFGVFENNITPERAHIELKRRSVSIFEPRPELNHATNASLIIGRRELTKKLILDRRAFLNSYDPTIDPDGKYLSQILNAVIPVCGGINLEYFFSRVDPDKFGSGSKLSHNVVSLIGVSNGIEGDLLTGLPNQMTEFHLPKRLAILVEQEPSIAIAALRTNSEIYKWVNNEWVRFFSIDLNKNIFEFKKGEMIKCNLI